MRGMCGRKDGKAKLLCGGLIKPNVCVNNTTKLSYVKKPTIKENQKKLH